MGVGIGLGLGPGSALRAGLTKPFGVGGEDAARLGLVVLR